MRKNLLNTLQRRTSKRFLGLNLEGQVIGAIGLKTQPDVYRLSAEMGYWIGEPFWGLGIISKAIDKVANYGYQHMELQRVFCPSLPHQSRFNESTRESWFQQRRDSKKMRLLKNGKDS